MAKYRLKISESAAKSLKKVPKADIPRIVEAIEQINKDPYIHGIRKLAGEDNVFRYRVGRYRIIYEVKNSVLLILVIKIGHRKDIYR